MMLHSSPTVTRAAEGLWRRRFTVADLEAMVAVGTIDESERIELIGGELVPMSPKGSGHERIKVALTRRWCKLAPDEIEVATQTTFRLSVDTLLEPDIILSNRAQDFTGLLGGDALLVVEVADSSRRYDTGRKAALYASFGVRELWVIDAVKLKTRVFRVPSPSCYLEAHDVASNGTATPLHAPHAFALRLADLGIK